MSKEDGKNESIEQPCRLQEGNAQNYTLAFMYVNQTQTASAKNKFTDICKMPDYK